MSTRKNTVGYYRNTNRKGKLFVLECYLQPNIKGTKYVHFFVKKNPLYVVFLFLLSQTAISVHLRLEKSLRLCSENDNNTDCCPKPLCVLETLQLSACLGNTSQTSALIQAKIYVQLFPVTDVSG